MISMPVVFILCIILSVFLAKFVPLNKMPLVFGVSSVTNIVKKID